MKIAIVSHLKLVQEILKQVISPISHYELIWTAWDGQEALKKSIENPPDLILMDLIMPNISGVESTRLIMETSPCAIIIVTETIENNANLIYEAMGYGALDAVCTPIFDGENEIHGAPLLLEKIEQVGRIIGKIHTTLCKATPFPIHPSSDKCPTILLIGASTGGPQALVDILSQLPEDFPIPIIIVQHVDIEFAAGLASWINASTPLTVQVAVEGVKPQKGNVYIAATKDHLVCSSECFLQYSSDPLDMIYRPSVDILFKSFAKYYDSTGIAVLLTGMGHDGAEGMLMLKNKGWLTIAQDKDSSILFGMPKAAIEQNAVDQVLSLKNIPQIILKTLNTHSDQFSKTQIPLSNTDGI